MYGISKDTKANSGSSYMRAGINENIELVNYGFEKLSETSTSPPVYTLTFANSGGGTFKYRMWDINVDRIRSAASSNPKQHKYDNPTKGYVKGQNITPEQSVAIALDRFASRAKHILTKYMSEEDSIISNVNTYTEFCNAMSAKLAGRTNGKLMRLKLIYNDNDYLSVPNSGDFLESMETTPSKLSMKPDEKVIRSKQSSTEAAVSAAVADGPDNDLPF